MIERLNVYTGRSEGRSEERIVPFEVLIAETYVSSLVSLFGFSIF